MMIKKCTLRFLRNVIAYSLAACLVQAAPQGNGRNQLLSAQDITSESVAVERAKHLTGFNQLIASATAKRIIVSSSDLPFLAKEVLQKAAWQVDFSPFPLPLKSGARGFSDMYPKRFKVILLEQTGQIVGISSSSAAEDSDMRDPPSSSSAERQMRGSSEIYTSLPSESPRITFLDALDLILIKGSGSPFLAKAIDAVYVMDATMETSARPVWSITLRGLPPFPTRGGHSDSVPAWQRNHMRNVIDAVKGQFLFATNSPQPI